MTRAERATRLTVMVAASTAALGLCAILSIDIRPRLTGAAGGGPWQGGSTEPSNALDMLAVDYVALARGLIARDADSSGGDSAVPDVQPEWNPDASRAVSSPVASSPVASSRVAASRVAASRTPEVSTPAGLSLSAIEAAASDAAARARQLASGAPASTDIERARHLALQLDAIAARAAILSGRRLEFGDELRRLFGVAVPAVGDHVIEEEVAAARRELSAFLPGRGSPAVRLGALERRVLVPAVRFRAVFERALEECRARTRSILDLPSDESVEIGYVVDRPWSGFSRYLGGHHSRIDVNVGLPLTVDRTLDLACHEGYPGHHAINTWRDQQRARRGLRELEAVPLFTPASFAAEALANDAAALLFTDEERLAFERDVLFPLAGLAPGEASAHVRAARLLARLRPAIAEAVVRYLRGDYDYVEAAWALEETALMQHPEATLGFVHQFRGLALAYVIRSGAGASRPEAHGPADTWAVPPLRTHAAGSRDLLTRR
ncbi:MAG: hypothetical protein AB7Q29_08275 [Vicinamibacterales bacterium]